MRQEWETRPLDDFERAYQAHIEQAEPVMRLTAAVVRLTGFGEQPVVLDRLATTLAPSTWHGPSLDTVAGTGSTIRA